MASSFVEVLNLNLFDLNRMKLEFQDCYDKLFDESIMCLRRTWLAKLKAMKNCRTQAKQQSKNGGKSMIDVSDK